MSPQDGLLDGEVADVGEDGPVQCRCFRQQAAGAQPHRLSRHPLALHPQVDRRRHMAHVHGSVGEQPLGHRVKPGQALLDVGQILRCGKVVGKSRLVLEAGIVILEGGDRGEDGHSRLEGLGASRGEGSAVVDAVHREGDALTCVAGTKEVAVHRMDRSDLGDRALCCDERLREHLAAVHAAQWHPLRHPGEDVLRGPSRRILQIEHGEHRGDGVGV